jgi:hypothetical protein
VENEFAGVLQVGASRLKMASVSVSAFSVSSGRQLQAGVRQL